MSLLGNGKHQVHFAVKDRYIRFLKSGKNRSFLAYGQKCLPEGVIVEGQIKERETLEMILDEIIGQWKLKGIRTSFSVPDSFVILRKISIPAEVMKEDLKEPF
ncbi:hypothetical protein ELQ35_14495 [Peribacillus cavernae]|uniref:Uncharacterized protein n=1 Tax=Peribacillus cavernae TaxID=1674310 RepID=A0A3S0UBN0_9BACI|nr:hypothetical protein [Peribacillus cavernae]MDQ0219380.1 Tfp pilus assembly PilM family ATPase [Peribacillus cavernae]RUQ27744.1 hypothetical protein ELQ35_14495 [Peribacillus cavernae]